MFTQLFAARVRPLICGTLGVILFAAAGIGCSSTSKIAQSSKGAVYLEEVTDWSFEASHPAIIDQGTIAKAIKGLYNDEGQDASSSLSAGGGKPMSIFNDGDAEFLSPLLAKALAKARPEQLVGFRVSPSAGSGSEPTTGTMYVKNDFLYVTISQGARVTGFMPESTAHSEEAPVYATGGYRTARATVIDYHALAKSPISTVMPIAKSTPKSESSPITVSAPAPKTPAAKPQLTASTSVSAAVQSEIESAGSYQADKVKETIAKKDTEIGMLRKEAEWMKRELRNRDQEIKALRATNKAAAKPVAKKKPTVELYKPPAN